MAASGGRTTLTSSGSLSKGACWNWEKSEGADSQLGRRGESPWGIPGVSKALKLEEEGCDNSYKPPFFNSRPLCTHEGLIISLMLWSSPYAENAELWSGDLQSREWLMLKIKRLALGTGTGSRERRSFVVCVPALQFVPTPHTGRPHNFVDALVVTLCCECWALK